LGFVSILPIFSDERGQPKWAAKPDSHACLQFPKRAQAEPKTSSVSGYAPYSHSSDSPELGRNRRA
jgi:hypothetical protein